VKAENLLVFEDLKAKLCDFGMAKEHFVSKRTTKMTLGTEGFKAPETLMGQGSFYASDVYSWAMTAYQMFVRKPPVASHSVQQKIDAIMKRISEDAEVANNKAACEAFRHLLQHCMQLDYKERPSSDYLCNEINRVKQMFGGDLRSFTSIAAPSPSMASEVTLNAKIDELQSELRKEETLREQEAVVSEGRRQRILQLESDLEREKHLRISIEAKFIELEKQLNEFHKREEEAQKTIIALQASLEQCHTERDMLQEQLATLEQKCVKEG
jgi:serine/threonine protein kinase